MISPESLKSGVSPSDGDEDIGEEHEWKRERETVEKLISEIQNRPRSTYASSITSDLVQSNWSPVHRPLAQAMCTTAVHHAVHAQSLWSMLNFSLQYHRAVPFSSNIISEEPENWNSVVK